MSIAKGLNDSYSLSNKQIKKISSHQSPCSYQYLGIHIKPSGSMQFGANELLAKANRAWFAISNVLYQHKKLAVKKALLLFDSLIKPIFFYAV